MPSTRVYRIRPPKADPYAGVEFSARINTWLIKHTYQALRRQPDLTDEDLESLLWEKASRYVVSSYDLQSAKAPAGTISDTQAEQLISSVIRFARIEYSTLTFSKIQRERAKRPRGTKRFQVADLLKHAGKTIKQTAAAMGCSPATVSKLRAEVAKSALGRLAYMVRSAKPRQPYLPSEDLGDEAYELHLSPVYPRLHVIELIPWRTT